jgi:RimJ/RimL family protein N-acetyltransferase
MLRESDVPDLFSVFSNPQVMRYWSRPAFPSMDDAWELFRDIQQHFQARTLFQWGIAQRTNDRVIGTCTLFHLEKEHRRAEIGFALGQELWGQGLMKEALGALLDFAFGTLDLRRLEADIDPRNARSIRTVERLGFQREGTLRERYHVNGEVQDTAYFGLLRDEWSENRAARPSSRGA